MLDDRLSVFQTHGKLIELMGAPGVGKSQLAMQLAAASLIHHETSHVVLLLSERNFSLERFTVILNGTILRYSLTVDGTALLSRLHVEYIPTLVLFRRAIEQLHHSAAFPISMVIVDNLPSLCREDSTLAIPRLFEIRNELLCMLSIYQACCLLLSSTNEAGLPALGISATYFAQIRLLLAKFPNLHLSIVGGASPLDLNLTFDSSGFSIS